MSAPHRLLPLVLADAIAPEILASIAGSAEAGALFSAPDHDAARWRFMLWRVWDPSMPPLVWCMLNPSTATHEQLDATIRRCIGWAQRWCFGGILVVNAYAFRSTDPLVMLREPGRVGLGNDFVLRCVLEAVARTPTPVVLPPQRVMLAWGDGIERAREYEILSMLREVQVGTHCLGRTRSGHPRHPVRVPYDTPVREWP